LGGSAKSARTRFTHRLPGTAVPALCGVAAAIALANAPAAPAAAQTVQARAEAHAQHATASAVTGPAAVKTALLLSATRATAKQSSATVTRYTVKSGDTLSAIAGHFYGNPDYWPVLYSANRGQIHYANEIEAGQVLTVPVKPAHIPGAPSALAPASSAPSTASTPASGADVVQQAAPVQDSDVSTSGDSSFQACVIARESGGNSQAEGAGGYYGLYQFSASTWAEYGGNPADYGNASAAEQNQVFDNAIAAGGESNWSSYDGC